MWTIKMINRKVFTLIFLCLLGIVFTNLYTNIAIREINNMDTELADNMIWNPTAKQKEINKILLINYSLIFFNIVLLTIVLWVREYDNKRQHRKRKSINRKARRK